MTYVPPNKLDVFKKAILLHPELPTKTAVLMHCHSEAEVIQLWQKFINERLEEIHLKTITKLAGSAGLYLPLPEKNSVLDKIKNKLTGI